MALGTVAFWHDDEGWGAVKDPSRPGVGFAHFSHIQGIEGYRTLAAGQKVEFEYGDDLQQDGSLTFSGANRRGYNYTAEVDDGQHFKITAKPSDPAKTSWPTLSIDETMQVTQQ